MHPKAGGNAVLTQIAGQFPREVALLFREYGINKEATAENLYYALILYKEPFANRLFTVTYGRQSSNDGTASNGKFFDILNNAIGVISGVKDVLNAPAPPAPAPDPIVQEPKKVLGMPVMLVAGIGTILFLVIILIILKKK